MRQFISLLAALGLSACGGGSMGSMSSMGSTPSAGTPPSSTNPSVPPAVATAKAASTAVDPSIVAADNAFGMSLFQKLQAAGTGNIAISPLSVALVLQILYNGTDGNAQASLAQTLQLGSLGPSAVNNDNAALQASLLDPDPQVQLSISNSLWSHLGSNPVLPAFTAMDQNFYGATVGDLTAAPQAVDAWISDATNGLITSLGDQPASYYSSLKFLLLNALYFKGAWTQSFDSTQTAPAAFTLAGGSQVTAQLMHQNSTYAYFQGANFQIARLPYGQGRMSMLVILPDSGVNLSEFVAALSIEQLNGYIAQMSNATGSIALPKFTASFSASLAPSLQSLGMAPAFCPAGLSGLAPGTCLSDVVHETMVEVDETGTTAAAVTGGAGVTVVGRSDFMMSCDHPFLYAIRDDGTGLLLFMGVLIDPAASH
jgi:serine protease inhibitor